MPLRSGRHHLAIVSRDLVFAQAALKNIAAAQDRSAAERRYWELVLHCLSKGEEYDIERGYQLRQALSADVGPDLVVVPEPDVLAVTEFSKLRGYDSKEAQEVLPGLWIGNSEPASLEAVRERGISHVVRCFDGSGYESCRTRDAGYVEQGIALHEVPLDDNQKQELLSHLGPAHRFIGEGLDDGGRVLIHCGAGISRCGAVTASFIMTRLRCNYQRALALIRAARPVVGPNAGFSKQLKEWEQEAMAC